MFMNNLRLLALYIALFIETMDIKNKIVSNNYFNNVALLHSLVFIA